MEDKDLLTAEQILLLENLTYLLDKSPLLSLKTIADKVSKDKKSITVEKIIDQIEVDDLIDDKNYGSFMTGKDWKNLITAIQQDETLKQIKMIEVEGDPALGENETSDQNTGKGALSVVFVNEESKEAIVAFRGTVEYEWGDNFLGGASTEDVFPEMEDKVSTEYQRKALLWYQSLGLEDAGYETITVTGHSKGGNKAKYITLLDGSVDRCFSFDGQGFSDEFILEYTPEIEARQGKITNHNVNYDFVNMLLNDVGKTIFYQGYDYGNGFFGEAHCPNTFFLFDENGNISMHPVEDRAWEIDEIDAFLNSYLRTMPPDKKKRFIRVVSKLADGVFSKEYQLTEAEWLQLAYFLDEVSDYADLHPEFTDAIVSILDTFLLNDTMKKIWERCPKNIKGHVIWNRIIKDFPAVISRVLEDNGEDLSLPLSYCPLEQNRVFDESKLKQFALVTKTLLDVGSEACITWDRAVEELRELSGLLPSEVISTGLESSLEAIDIPFARTEDELLGSIVFNNISRLTQAVVEHDSTGAMALDEITERLAAKIAIISELEESTKVYYAGPLA
ncbi:MAG: DUF2974 domain-containing protein [Lachnospiraceae bacterium]|nr:DUF2974 domain-containing protein [Lachnospiraceae bacterium]